MKGQFLFIALFICFLFASCNNDKDNSNNDQVYGQSLQEQPKLQQSEEELREQRERQLRQQMYIDSVNRAKAVSESIERERKIRLIEEDKQRKISDANAIIQSFSSTFMERVSPATGKELNWNILYDESSYDELTSTMNVVFETSWNAVAAFDFGPMEKHIFKGKLILYGTGETRQETISENDVLKRAIKATKGAEDIEEWLDKNSKKNSN